MIRRPPTSTLFPYTPLSRSPSRRTAIRPALGLAAALLLTTCSTDTQPAAPRTTVRPDLTVTLSGGQVLVGAGHVSTCRNSNDAATATLLDGNPGTGVAARDPPDDNGA